jgi:hypothetical protein
VPFWLEELYNLLALNLNKIYLIKCINKINRELLNPLYVYK